jgi:hypothetical protein
MPARALTFYLAISTSIACGCDGDGREDCDCSEGPCCDGCDFHGPAIRCDEQPVSTTSACRSDECGSDVMQRGLFKHCSGVSEECTERVLLEGIWEVAEDCSDDQVCVVNDGEAMCHSCSLGCTSGYCNEDYCASGPCCDDNHLAAPSVQCSDHIEASECRCSDDECGADVECRNQYRFCTGLSPDCTADNLAWGDWRGSAECSSDQICVAGDGRGECRDCSLGCEHGECRARECTTGDCCDGAFFLPEGRICSSEVAYRCTGTECGADAQRGTATKRCNGTDQACHGETEYSDWTTIDVCSTNQVCVSTSPSTASFCRTCDHGCVDGACQEP